MVDRHRWKRWTPERCEAITEAIAARKTRLELLAILQAMPGEPIERDHLIGFVRYHHGAAGLDALSQIQRRPPLVINQAYEQVSLQATPYEVVAYAREVGITGRITLAIVNEHRMKHGRDPFCLVAA